LVGRQGGERDAKMSRKGLVKFIVGGSLLAILLKYVYLIIPLIITVFVLRIIRRRRVERMNGVRGMNIR